MEQSTGRTTEPSTEADAPDARETATPVLDAPELHTPNSTPTCVVACETCPPHCWG